MIQPPQSSSFTKKPISNQQILQNQGQLKRRLEGETGLKPHEKTLEALKNFTKKQEDIISKNAELLKQFKYSDQEQSQLDASNISISYLRDKYNVSHSKSPLINNIDDPNSSQNIFQKSFSRDLKIGEKILDNNQQSFGNNFEQFIELEKDEKPKTVSFRKKTDVDTVQEESSNQSFDNESYTNEEAINKFKHSKSSPLTTIKSQEYEESQVMPDLNHKRSGRENEESDVIMFEEPNDINLYQTKNKIEFNDQSKDLGKYINLAPIQVIKNQAQVLVAQSNNGTMRSEYSQSKLMSSPEKKRELSQEQRAHIQERLNQSKASLLSKRSIQSNQSFSSDLNNLLRLKRDSKNQTSKMLNIQEPDEENFGKQALNTSELMTYAGFGNFSQNWPATKAQVETSGEPRNFNNTGKQRNRINTGATILERAKFAAQEQSEPMEMMDQSQPSLNKSYTPYMEDDIEIIPEEESQSNQNMTMNEDRQSRYMKNKFLDTSSLQENQQLINKILDHQASQFSQMSLHDNVANTSTTQTSNKMKSQLQPNRQELMKSSLTQKSKNQRSKLSPKQILEKAQARQSQSPKNSSMQEINKYYPSHQYSQQRIVKQKPFTEEKQRNHMSLADAQPKNQTLTIQKPQKNNVMTVFNGIQLPIAAKLGDNKSKESLNSDLIEIEGFRIPDQIQPTNQNKRMKSFGQAKGQNTSDKTGSRKSQLISLEPQNNQVKTFLRRGGGKTIGSLIQAQREYGQQPGESIKNFQYGSKVQSNSLAKNSATQQSQKKMQPPITCMNQDLKSADYDNDDYISVNIKNKASTKQSLQIPSHIRQQPDHLKAASKSKQKIGHQICNKFYGTSKHNRPQSAFESKKDNMFKHQKQSLKVANHFENTYTQMLSNSDMKFYKDERQMQLSNKGGRPKSPPQMQFQVRSSKEQRLNSKSKDKDILKSNSKKDIHTVINNTINSLIDQEKDKQKPVKFSNQKDMRNSMPAHTAGAFIQSTRSNHSISTNQMAFSVTDNQTKIEMQRMSTKSLQAHYQLDKNLKIAVHGNYTPNPQLANQIYNNHKISNLRTPSQHQAQLNNLITTSSPKFQESSRLSNQFSSQPRHYDYSRDATEKAKRISQLSVNPKQSQPLSQHNGPFSPTIASPSSMGSDMMKSQTLLFPVDKTLTNQDINKKKSYNIALTTKTQFNGSRLIAGRSETSSQERLQKFNQVNTNYKNLQPQTENSEMLLIDDEAVQQTKRYFSPDPASRKNALNQPVARSDSRHQLKRAGSLLQGLKKDNKLNQRLFNQRSHQTLPRHYRRFYESVPSKILNQNLNVDENDGVQSIQSPHSNHRGPKSMKSYLGSSNKSLRSVGSKIQNRHLKNRSTLERSLMPQALNTKSQAQKVQDQFYNNSFNRVGKHLQESQSSGGLKALNDSTSKKAQQSQYFQPASSRYGGQSKYQQDLNQTLNLENDSFFLKDKCEIDNNFLHSQPGDSFARHDISAINFKGDQSTIKMQTPLNPMLKTIKSELEDDDECDEGVDDRKEDSEFATLEMQFDDERTPQKSNLWWQSPQHQHSKQSNGASNDLSSYSSPLKNSISKKFQQKQAALKIQHQNYFQDQKGQSSLKKPKQQRAKVNLNDSLASNVSNAFRQGQLTLEKSPNQF